jgi:hypothetical protein
LRYVAPALCALHRRQKTHWPTTNARSIGDEELDIDGVDGAYWYLDLLEGIEDLPSEDVMLLKQALRDFIREQEEAV